MSKRVKAGSPLVAVGYIRASKSSQKLTLEAQRTAIEAWSARTGVSVASWHVDAGVRSVTPIEKRPALLGALAALRTHGAGVLVVAKRDRIARKPALTETIETAAAVCGARVLSADGASDAKGIEGIMVKGVTDLFAQVERERIAERVREALAEKRARGERTGGGMPFGFALAADGAHRIDKETGRPRCASGCAGCLNLVPLESEQAVIRRARELAEGRSQRAVAAELAREGHLSRVGRVFAAAQIARMLAGVETSAAAA
jgi:DNA invertase Pin-like site-specific DNA recombinase